MTKNIHTESTENTQNQEQEVLGHTEQVSAMFGEITKRYDLLNHLLSGGLDFWWRYKLVNSLVLGPEKKVLDIAAGTLDVSLSILRTHKDSTVVAGDICLPMLEYGKRKVKMTEMDRIHLEVMDAQNLPQEDAHFDVVTMAFGIRNVDDRAKALKEMHRVLKTGGQLAILEFCPNKTPVLGKAFHWYTEQLMPRIAKLLGENSTAYTYLAESIKKFPFAPDFVEELKASGFEFVKHSSLNFGAANLFIAIKS